MTSEPVYTLEGHVFYLVKLPLFPNSTLHVFLQDVTLADAPAKELARCVIPNAETAGLNFKLVFAAADVVPGHSYAISACLTNSHQKFINEHHPVLLNGEDPQPLDVLVS